MVGIAQLVRAPGCGPGGHGFDPHYSPHEKSDFCLPDKGRFFIFFDNSISKTRILLFRRGGGP